MQQQLFITGTAPVIQSQKQIASQIHVPRAAVAGPVMKASANGDNIRIPQVAPNMQKFMSSVAEEGQKCVDFLIPPQQKAYQLAYVNPSPSVPANVKFNPSSNFNFGTTSNVQQNINQFSA